MYIYTHIYTYIYIHICILYIYMYKCIYTYAYIHMYIYTYMHIYIHIHISIFTYVYVLYYRACQHRGSLRPSSQLALLLTLLQNFYYRVCQHGGALRLSCFESSSLPHSPLHAPLPMLECLKILFNTYIYYSIHIRECTIKYNIQYIYERVCVFFNISSHVI